MAVMMQADNEVASQIVAAARLLFLRSGYSQVSTEQIARSIGRSKKTLYKHFETKEVLLQAALAQVDGETEVKVAAVLADRSGDGLTRLRGVLAVVAVHLADLYQVLFADLRENQPELGRQAWQERRRAIAQMLEPVLRDTVARRVIRADMTTESVLNIICCCVEGLGAPPDPTSDGSGRPDVIGALVSLIVDGLRLR